MRLSKRGLWVRGSNSKMEAIPKIHPEQKNENSINDFNICFSEGNLTCPIGLCKATR